MSTPTSVDGLVPWPQQTAIVRKLYSCGRCDHATERYRALGNIPMHAHLCTACWQEDIHREHYIRVEVGP
jgi:hypothetical protein